MKKPIAAGIFRRLFAMFIDFGLFFCYVVLFILSLLLISNSDAFLGIGEWGMNLLGLLIWLPPVIYSILTECSPKHASLGKRIAKLKVVSLFDNELTKWQIIIRNLIKFLPWLFAHITIFRVIALNGEMRLSLLLLMVLTYATIILYILLMILIRDHRGVPDLIAKTIVINDGT